MTIVISKEKHYLYALCVEFGRTRVEIQISTEKERSELGLTRSVKEALRKCKFEQLKEVIEA